MSETWGELRNEVLRRFQVWGWQTAPARLYALLVAGYCRTQAEHLTDEMALTLREGELVRLAEWVEAAADRPLIPAERADAFAVAAAVRAGVQSCLSSYTNGGSLHNPFGVVDCLRTALDDPLRAAGRLIGYPGVDPEEGVWAWPNTCGAICRQVSQSMQVASTKKSPGAFSGTRLQGFAKSGPPFAAFYPPRPGAPSADRAVPTGKMGGSNVRAGGRPRRSGERPSWH